MIVKNEASILDDCLSALSSLNCEIVIVDTGSNDNTKEIALNYTDKLYDFKWCNDFSAARNYAVSMASNDCILTVDADEILILNDLTQLQKCVTNCTNPDFNVNVHIPPVGRTRCRSIYERSGEKCTMTENLSRMFSRQYYHYEGIIHEQLVPLNKSERSGFIDVPLTFEHRGYNGNAEFIENKTSRNIALLKKACEENPEDSYLLYQLGKSYFMRKDYLKSYELFDKCLYFDLDPQLEYVQDLVESYGYSMLNTDQYEKALQLSGIYDDFSSSCEFVFLMGLIYMNNGIFDSAVNEFKKAASFVSCKIEGSNSYLAYYNIAVIYECTGDKALARTYYKKCGNYDLARKRLRKL